MSGMNVSMRAYLLCLTGLVIVENACSQRADLKPGPVLEVIGRKEGNGSIIQVCLTAGTTPIFFQRDADTKLVPYEVQVRLGNVWKKADISIWHITPERPVPELKPGRSLTFNVNKPETKGIWRVGILVYSKTPAHGVPNTMVWTSPIPP